MGISQVSSAAAANAVGAVEKLYTDSQKEMDSILQASTDLFEVQQSNAQISADSNTLEETSKALLDSFDTISYKRFFPNNYWAIGSGFMALFALVFLLRETSKTQRVQLSETKQINQRNQEAILRLLDEIGSLGEGDLTVK